jgi:hypothetical protein
MIYTGLLDANVLYPAPLRDLLLQLAVPTYIKRSGRRIFTGNGSRPCFATNRTGIVWRLNGRGT